MKVVIIHGWEGWPEEGWFPWIKEKLEEKGIEVEVPAMPIPEAPHIDRWVPFLSRLVKNEDTILVGHSAGCITILRYLESSEITIKGSVLVAGFTDDLGYEELSNYFQKPIEWDNIKEHCKRFIAIHSDNDKYVDLKHGDIFKEKLGAEIIIKHQKGHFSGSDGTKELPSALEAVLKLASM